MSTVNIILATHNGAEHLSELIESCIRQNYSDWTLYIYDDCSDDGTQAIASEYADQYPERIRFTAFENEIGLNKAFLLGAKNASPADYYMFCDQDDIWMKDKISLSVRAIRKIEKKYGKDRPALVFSDAILVDSSLSYISNSFFKTDHLRYKRTDLPHLLIENKCLGCTSMVNGALVRLISIPDSGIRYHDWWVALIASSFGHIRFIKYPTLLYREKSCNQMMQNKYKKYFRRRELDSKDIGKRLDATFKQAETFLRIYGPMMKSRRRKIITSFAELRDKGFFMRRILLIRHRFLKSGLMRNLGLFLHI